MFLFGFILGAFVGAFVGILIVALCTVSHQEDSKLSGEYVTNYVTDGNFAPPVNWCGEEPQGNMDDSDKFIGFM